MQSTAESVLVKGPKFPLISCPDQERCGLLQQTLSQKAKIEAENEQLRGIFAFAQKEFEKKNKRIEYLEQKLSTLRDIERENKNLKQQLEQTIAKANLLSRMLYGRKSEKSQPIQAESNNILESGKDRQEQDYGGQEKRKRGATRGHKGYGRNIPDNLPFRDQIIDIPEDQKKCAYCDKPLMETDELQQVSFEISSEKIYYVKRIMRKAYKKACSCPQTRALTIAPPPP